MAEAKSLLRGWVDQELVDVPIADELEQLILNGKSCVHKKLKNDFRSNLMSELISSEKNGRNPSFKIRHELAKERRSLLDGQKRLRAAQLATVPKIGSTSNKTDFLAIDDIAITISKQELNDMKEQQDREALANLKEAELNAKKIALARAIKEDEEEKKKERLRLHAEYIQQGYEKAERLYQASNVRIKKLVVKALTSAVKCTKKNLLSFTLKYSWISLNRSWENWKGKRKKLKEAREYNVMVLEIRDEQLKIIASIRHHRLKSLSTALLSWKQFLKLTLEQEDRLISMHRQREAQMNQFLLKFEQNLEKDGSPRPAVEKKDFIKTQTEFKKKNIIISERKSLAETTKSSTQAPLQTSTVKIPKLSNKDLKLVRAMAEREHQRLKRKEEARLRREEKKKEMEQQLILVERQKEAAENEQREKIIQEKKLLELEAKKTLQLKEREKERLKEQWQLAKTLNRKLILKYYGFIPLRKFSILQQANNSIADGYRNSVLKESIFKDMHLTIVSKQNKQNSMALSFSNCNILKASIMAWKQKILKESERSVIAHDYHAYSLLNFAYHQWKCKFQSVSHCRKEIEAAKEKKADLCASKIITRRVLLIWKQFVLKQKEERWREYRKERLRAIAKEQLSQFSTL